MKNRMRMTVGLASLALAFTACSDFEEINKDPNAISEDNAKVSYIMNRAIMDAQMDPHIQERMFVLQWKSAARYERSSGIATGANYDDWNKDYFGTGYGVGWLNTINLAVKIGTDRAANPKDASDNNVLQMCRIWRAYIISELADNFGPIPPVNVFDGVIEYKNVQDIYSFILSELKDASEKLDLQADMKTVKDEKTDAFYEGDAAQWQKYANSLRMRYAMRLSKVDPSKAQAEFEDAAKSGKFIASMGDIAWVQEKGGWSCLDGVMSRAWNAQPISVTLNNLMIGLGGVDFQVPEAIKGEAVTRDARTYLGVRLSQHLPVSTNDPAAGYFFDALPSKIDPRATKLFHIPGYDDGKIYYNGLGLADVARLVNPATNSIEDGKYMTLKTKYTWNTWVAGKWDKLSALSSELTGASKNYPSISNIFRNSQNKRVWFGPWESYFLLAEAAYYGWNVPGSAKSNYEAGIAQSFEYIGVSEFYDEYIRSTEYNRVGTSVAFDHTAEATAYEAEFVDGYTGAKGTVTYRYPKNSIYKNGTVNNDQLTKIITQKYLAQCPYQPLEAWNDHRRLGLPFFENQAVEVDYDASNNQLPLTKANCKECRWEFYQERLMYPKLMETNSKESYDLAVGLLGGENKISTPLWWAKH